MEIVVADVVITRRTVTVPLVCPHCEADLVSEDGEITCLLRTLDDMSAHATIQDGDLEDLETEGSDTLVNLDVSCDSCKKSVLTAPGTIN